MQNYREYVKQIFPLGFKDLVYYYDSTEYNGIYDSFFNFCQENISTQWPNLNFQPCFIYFRNDEELQAAAIPLITGERIIEINSGLFERLNDIFYQNREFIDNLPGVRHFQQLELIDAPVYYLMFQELTLFLYYHELGHIVQFAGYDKIVTERNMIANGYDSSLLYHVMEMDSDEIAANYTIQHIMSTWEKAPEKDRSVELLETLITMNLAAIFILFDLLEGDEGIQLPIYYHETTHPHSAIRIIAITALFLDNVKLRYGDVGPSTDNILKRTFLILSVILKENPFIEDFPRILKKENKNLNDYFKVVLAEREKYPWLAASQIDTMFQGLK